ncbi:sensor histidine kinase [Marinibactrum halimedae]|uniref:histidine kinase n=1 Tax=Marinibactrum halimedae TaxID=1444977 RepID=A0AA37T5H2_9GAMM|nr:ATP-binding protein [Marinibactrum halimedae]MCD9459228.1 ATP-binding protein [Marinibactrum halimedae]GLS27300.1 hypothetical protein GCM10007877_30190 [Marinibactrum halimedae]
MPKPKANHFDAELAPEESIFGNYRRLIRDQPGASLMTPKKVSAHGHSNSQTHSNQQSRADEADSEIDQAELEHRLADTRQYAEQEVERLAQQGPESKSYTQPLSEATRRSPLSRQAARPESTGAGVEDVLDALPAGVIVLDARGMVTHANPAAQTLLKAPLLNRAWREVLKASFVKRVDDGHEISTVDGKRLGVSTRSLTGDREGQLVLLTDQTETRRLQTALSQHQRLSSMGKMVSALAHQVRTPLSAAMLYASHLQSEALGEEKRTEFTQKLCSRLRHLERQVQDMLLFVKGELPINDERSQSQIIQELEAALELPVRSAGAKVQWHVSKGEFTLRCNADALINALLNLINNSLQAYTSSSFSSASITGASADETSNTTHSPALVAKTIERQLDVVVESTAEGIVLGVRDYGPGIAPDVMQKLNTPFVTTKAQGTGLGLTVVRTVAQAHGGEFRLRSMNPGVYAAMLIPHDANASPAEETLQEAAR